MDQSPQHGQSSLETPRRTQHTPLPRPKDSMREVGLVAAILLGLVLAIGGIWMYQEQANDSSTTTRAAGKKDIARKAKTAAASAPDSRSTASRAVPASAARLSPVPSSGEFDIYFDVGQDSLTAETKALLAKHAPHIASHKDVGVLLHGHADPRGSASFNDALGRRRARAVEAELVKLGVPKTAIQVFSQGEQNARCRSKTQACYRKNRRVHVSWNVTSELTSASARTAPAPVSAQAEGRTAGDDRTGDSPKRTPVRAAQAAPK